MGTTAGITPGDFFSLHREICRRWRKFLDAQANGMPGGFHSGCNALQLFCHIGAHPGCSLNEAAAATGVGPGTASSLIDFLCSAGILRRTLDPGDRRRICLSVTPAAKRFLFEIENLLANRIAAADDPTHENPAD